MFFRKLITLALLIATLAASRVVDGQEISEDELSVPPVVETLPQRPPTVPAGTGLASYYHAAFHGRRTASGETFNQNALTAAHRTLPFGTLVRVINLRNQRSIIVRVNDRGPVQKSRVIDVTPKAARELGFLGRGMTQVKIEVVPPGDLANSDEN